jgi:hypothetical protein
MRGLSLAMAAISNSYCDRYGTAFYDLKTPEEKVQRAIQQNLEGMCLEAVACIEDVHPPTVQRLGWMVGANGIRSLYLLAPASWSVLALAHMLVFP